MKKLILSLLACGSIAAANAQTGSVLVYGNVGLTSESNADDSKALNWSINPGVGYQFNHDWTAGLYLNYANEGTKAGTTGAVWMRTNEMQVGAFARYTKNLNRIFSVFGQLNAGWVHGNATLDGEVIDGSRYNGFAIGFAPSVAANIHNGWALTLSLGGISYKTSTIEDAENSSNMFNVNFAQTMVWGIQKNIGGHNHRIHREPGSDRHMKNYRDDDGDEKKSKDDE